METKLPLEEFPWLENDRPNGFRVYVDATPYEFGQSPAAASNGAETFIKVKPEFRVLSTNCAEYNHLALKRNGFYFDPEGFACTAIVAVSVARKYFSCDYLQYLFRPNATTACSPIAFNIATSKLAAGDFDFAFDINAQSSAISFQMLVTLGNCLL